LPLFSPVGEPRDPRELRTVSRNEADLPVCEATSAVVLRSLRTRTVIVGPLGRLRTALMSRAAPALENAALHRQLGVCLRDPTRPRLRPSNRVFWVALRRPWPDWTRAFVVVRPETVIAWHRQDIRLDWRHRSGNRPRIAGSTRSWGSRASPSHTARQTRRPISNVWDSWDLQATPPTRIPLFPESPSTRLTVCERS
jgi:hypothetical protein